MTEEKAKSVLDVAEAVVDEAAGVASGKSKVASVKERLPKLRIRKPHFKKISNRAKIIVCVVAVVAIAGGAGMLVWHEQPSFCGTMCHIEQTYYNNYMQEQGVEGTDKYGNTVSNSNAMMAVLHSHNDTTAKSEIVCVDCHIPNMLELAHDGVNYMTGNYPMPRDERSASMLGRWDGKQASEFCANENCHVYLLGNDGYVDMAKLADVTSDLEFNPHQQHHEGLYTECTSCHKGHRASTIICTACHQHEDVELPDGWVDWNTQKQIMVDAYGG